MIYVIGHKNPDSDSVCSAIALADLKRQLGEECEARVAGEINSESKFILEKFGVSVPAVLDDASGKDIILVDHTDFSQTVEGARDANIVGIVDHHNLGGVSTGKPLEVLMRPFGSTCTIIKNLFDYYNKGISKEVAGLMLCAILSDTVVFKSPTVTDEDKKVAEELVEIAGVDNMTELGYDMIKSRSGIENFSPKDLIMRDYKDYDMSGKKVGITQLELADLDIIKDVEQDLVEEIKKLQGEGRHSVFLMLTDVMKEGSRLLGVSEEGDIVKKVFGEGDDDWFSGVLSRKKQIVPKLEEYFR